MSQTMLQYHLRQKTLPFETIMAVLKLDRSTLHKWRLGVLYPNRLNAMMLIDLFDQNGITMDYNDIYQVNHMDKAV